MSTMQDRTLLVPIIIDIHKTVLCVQWQRTLLNVLLASYFDTPHLLVTLVLSTFDVLTVNERPAERNLEEAPKRKCAGLLLVIHARDIKLCRHYYANAATCATNWQVISQSRRTLPQDKLSALPKCVQERKNERTLHQEGSPTAHQVAHYIDAVYIFASTV